MTLTNELIVAADLLLYPERSEVALRHLTSDDFREPRCRAVFDGVTSLWRRYPMLNPDDAAEVTIALCERRLGGSRLEALGCLEYVVRGAESRLYHEVLAEEPKSFPDRCIELAGNGLLRRVRDKLGRWYVSLSGASPLGHVREREYDPATARRAVEGLLDDLNAEVARMPGGSRH